MKILVTRTDRLGDVMLATPVVRKIAEAYPQAKITFLVQKTWMPVLQYENPNVELMEYDPSVTVDALAAKLAAEKFDSAVVIRDEKTVTRAVKKAKIPVRIGPYSTFRSFFAFNRGVFQKRSKCKMHEAEYNLDLLKELGIQLAPIATTASELPKSWVKYRTSADPAVFEFLKANGLHELSYVCVHPGSSGSARYIPTELMVDLVKGLQLKGHRVVLTGTVVEAALLGEIASLAPGAVIFGGSEQKPLDQLAALYARAKVVVAHGTGPLHLAAALGAPVFAIFPPIFVLSEKRWGPLTENRVVWVPPGVDCPAKYKCLGPKCGYYDCMLRFEVTSAVQKIETLMLKQG
jgi:heptosyltransferase-3